VRLARTLEELHSQISEARAAGKQIAFIPTMGALHEGHLSLLRQGQRLANYCVVSIFVNPRQFNSQADLDKYPRSEERDTALLQNCGADLLFLPSAGEIYPAGDSEITPISAGSLGNWLEGSSRPGHFDGMLTVVSRLLDLVQPDFAIFGEKDAQQLFLIQKLVEQQNRQSFRPRAVQVVAGPTVREASGLALSSRNARLKPAQLEEAAGIYGALKRAASELEKGTPALESISIAKQQMPKSVTVDYVELVSAAEFALVSSDFSGEAILLFAGELAGVRLIDNVRVTLPLPTSETGQTRATDQKYEGLE